MASQSNTSDQQVVIGISSGLLFLTTFVVYLRLYIRYILKPGSAGWDDVVVSVAWFMALSASIATYVEISSGLGRHIKDITSHQFHKFNLARLIMTLFYTVGLNFAKLSFLAQFYRAFADRAIRRLCMCFAFFCSLWMIVQTILYSFTCVPIQYLIPSMSTVCIPTGGIWSAIGVINVLTDVIIFCIPLKPLSRMSLLRRQRDFLMGIFCFGFLICVISVARIPALRNTASSADPTFTNGAPSLLSLAELESAIICTSLPVLRPIVARFVPGVAPPAGTSEQVGTGEEGSGRADKNGRGAKYRDDSLLNTNLSGSTVTTRSFFRSLTTRDEEREDEQSVLPAASKTSAVETTDGKRDEKKSMDTTKIVEVKQRKTDEKKNLETPFDFFHCPTLKKGTQKPAPIVPRDLRKDASLDSSWKALPTPMTITRSSPQSSTRKLLLTPISPLSTHFSAHETTDLSSARTTNSFFRPRHRPGDDFYSQYVFSHTCNVNSEAFTREVCSVCSSELLPERLRAPALPPPELPPLELPPLDDKAQDAGTQTTSFSRKRKQPGTSQRRRGGGESDDDDDVMVTQATQTATPWASSVESSRAPSLRRSEEDTRIEIEVARQGTITRARERAMQAIAEKTYGQVGEVHQGRARVVQVDSSQRRLAAIGLDEVMGLDGGRGPRLPSRPVQSRKEAVMVSEGKTIRPAADTLGSKMRPTMEPEPMPGQQQNQQQQHHHHQQQQDAAARNKWEVKETFSTLSSSQAQVSEASRHTEPTPSASERRAATTTSWLRLSTDFGYE